MATSSWYRKLAKSIVKPVFSVSVEQTDELADFVEGKGILWSDSHQNPSLFNLKTILKWFYYET